MWPDAQDLESLIASSLGEREAAHQLRVRRVVEPVSATHVKIDGREYVNFASNNYLGLTHHPEVIAATRVELEREGVGSGAAALISGYGSAHQSCEKEIARWKGTGGAVLLPSGYQANHAAVQTLAALGGKRGVRFLIDKLVHASLVDAVRASGAEMRVFPHNGMEKLERLLRKAAPGVLQIVITESIFSMDGDAADLAALVQLKHRWPFVLMLDEAHGSGVYGDNGGGYAEELGLGQSVDVTVVTLSKALGCAGGAVCGLAGFCEAVVNFGRAYIYTTQMPALLARAAESAVQLVQKERARRNRVRSLARMVRERLVTGGLCIPSGDSPIIPVVLGSENAAIAASKQLLDAGLLAPSVRPPTVAKGSARLRITLSSEHTDGEIERLLGVLSGLSVTSDM